MQIYIPENIRTVLDILHNNGYEAYIVGGCVRDAVMGKEPDDYDICTSAYPEQIKECFAGFTTIDTGIRFGTVVVVSSGENVEVTTYRIDGKYSDGRHPESVTFTPSLREDLARRDFTVNALAYSEEEGVMDFFSGEKAIEEQIIEAVGEAEKRFEEDSLRIMRALRFASVLGFAIEKSTDEAIRRLFYTLKKVSMERIQTELVKLIMGKDADRILMSYSSELKETIEGIKPCTVNSMPENKAYRLGVIFPENTDKYLKKLKFDNRTTRSAKNTAEIRKGIFPEKEDDVLMLLNRYGEEIVKLFAEEHGRSNFLLTILNKKPCYSIKQLNITGSDLIREGIAPGPEIGDLLEKILTLVISGTIRNTKEDISAYIKKEFNGKVK